MSQLTQRRHSNERLQEHFAEGTSLSRGDTAGTDVYDSSETGTSAGTTKTGRPTFAPESGYTHDITVLVVTSGSTR